MAAILRICLEGSSKVQIMYQSGLNTRGVTGYIELLERRRLIELRGERYVVAEKGREYLRYYERITTILNDVCEC